MRLTPAVKATTSYLPALPETHRNRTGKALFRPEAAARQQRPYKDGWSIQRAVDVGMLRSVWVYRAVQAIATNQAKVPFVERDGDWWDGKIIENSPIAKALNANVTGVHSINTTIFRRMMSQQYLLNKQGAMAEIINNKRGDFYSLNLLPPNYTSPEPDPVEFIKRWCVDYPNTEKRYLKREEVIWVREPHPYDYYTGLTPLEAAGLSVEMDWYARLWNRNFILNDGRPAAIVAVKGEVDDDVAQDMVRRIGAGGGPNSAGKMIVIETEQGAELLEFGASPRDAQYADLRTQAKEEVLIAFGVPESVAGNASGRTFANADAELEIFWRETMVPHMEGIARAFDVLTPRDDRFISFDWSRIPILERDAREKRSFALQEFNAGAIAHTEYREETGRVPGYGNVTRLYRGVGLSEVGDAEDKNWVDPMAQPQEEQGFGEEPPPEEGDEFAQEQGQIGSGGEEPVGEPGLPESHSWLDDILSTPRNRAKGLTAADFIEVKVDDGDEAKEQWLALHGAWEATFAAILDNHMGRQQRVVTEKLTGRKSRERYERVLADA